jgi:DNA polymerase (family X)
MTNSDIADVLKWYANLSELHDGNPFKIKSYQAASFKLDKLQIDLTGKTPAEIETLAGIGKSVAAKVSEIIATQTFDELEQLINETPEGVRELFKVKGIGPKKIAYLWNNLGIESVGELWYACHENRLVEAKGFGAKTQQAIKENIEFIFSNANKFHYAKIEKIALDWVTYLQSIEGVTLASLTGEVRRKCDVVDKIELCVAIDSHSQQLKNTLQQHQRVTELMVSENQIAFVWDNHLPIVIYTSTENQFTQKLFETTATAKHLELIGYTTQTGETENTIYQTLSLPFIEPELREGLVEVERAKQNRLPKLIELTDLKGCLHNHSTYSDGSHTLLEMATYCNNLGYEYFGICDHSKAAQYANGMSEDTIQKQHAEIESINQQLAPFKVFKGIECDILGDGSLDYSNEVLASFDFVVASIHSNLQMTSEKAMHRLIKAIENPYTTILGHPTGRLLLMRAGYPVDMPTMIDACAANGVVIELNANPYRLDIDWRWIDYALNKGVLLSINPDAHEQAGIHDMHYGVCVARKGGLEAKQCLNAFSVTEIATYFKSRKVT